MSILSSLYHGEIHDKPNDVHNVAATPNKKTDSSNNMTQSAKLDKNALINGGVLPALFYTEQEQTRCEDGVWESPHTVASKLESKEEYPQG